MSTVGADPVANLLALAQAGDQGAMVALLATTQRDIRRYARRSCQLEDVDDAVQEALTVMARRVKALRTPAALLGWLFVVVTRECYRLARRATRFRQPADALADELVTQPEPELRYDLACAIQALPEHYRRIVIARDIEECTISEIAAADGITREATKARLRRARELLREYLTGTVH